MSKTKKVRETVRPAALMNQQTLRMHIRARHSHLRYWSRSEHDADHADRPKTLDHDHQEEEQ
jgi:hypothetical protein